MYISTTVQETNAKTVDEKEIDTKKTPPLIIPTIRQETNAKIVDEKEINPQKILHCSFQQQNKKQMRKLLKKMK